MFTLYILVYNNFQRDTSKKETDCHEKNSLFSASIWELLRQWQKTAKRMQDQRAPVF